MSPLKILPRAKNQKPGKLARRASRRENSPLPELMVVRIVKEPAVGIEVVEVEPRALEWALDIIRYLDPNEVPNNMWEAKKISNRVARYTIVDGVLYRKGYSTPLLRCISFEEAKYVREFSATTQEGRCWQAK